MSDELPNKNEQLEEAKLQFRMAVKFRLMRGFELIRRTVGHTFG